MEISHFANRPLRGLVSLCSIWYGSLCILGVNITSYPHTKDWKKKKENRKLSLHSRNNLKRHSERNIEKYKHEDRQKQHHKERDKERQQT